MAATCKTHLSRLVKTERAEKAGGGHGEGTGLRLRPLVLRHIGCGCYPQHGQRRPLVFCGRRRCIGLVGRPLPPAGQKVIGGQFPMEISPSVGEIQFTCTN